MRRLSLVLLSLALVALGACAGDDAKSEAAPKAAKADVEVTVKDFVFGPKEIRVAEGGSVTWTNKDDFDHSVVIGDLDIDGPKFGPQTMPASYTQQFTTAGTYSYFCGVHNSMTGTVVVTK